MFPAPA